MAGASLSRQLCKSHKHFASYFFKVTRNTTSFSATLCSRPFQSPFQGRFISTITENVAGFDEMASGTQRKYYLLGGKGGVGKTSCAASLAVKFANHGHPTIIVSTDPAHSLSDSFDQDLKGGKLVLVQGVDSPLYALEIDPATTKEELRAASQKNSGKGVKDFMDSMGLGMLGDQLEELKLGELLDTPPPGLDEAIAISKVLQFVESTEYSSFSRIVFDTAPTGHTLRLLSLPDFLDSSLGKMIKLKDKIASTTSAIKSVFSKEEPRQNLNDKLEQLRERVIKVRDLFRNAKTTEFVIVKETSIDLKDKIAATTSAIKSVFSKEEPRQNLNDKLDQLRESVIKVRDLFRNAKTTEFVIVTIPTVMAINESTRLCASLKKESVPVKRLIVNQVLPSSASDCKFCAIKRKDQMRAFDMIKKDPQLGSLRMIESPMSDVEIRGVRALEYMGNLIWR